MIYFARPASILFERLKLLAQGPRGLSGRSRTRIYIARSMQRPRLSPMAHHRSAQTRVDRKNNRRPLRHLFGALTVGGYSSVMCSLVGGSRSTAGGTGEGMQVSCKTWEAKSVSLHPACMRAATRAKGRLVRIQYHSTCMHALPGLA